MSCPSDCAFATCALEHALTAIKRTPAGDPRGACETSAVASCEEADLLQRHLAPQFARLRLWSKAGNRGRGDRGLLGDGAGAVGG